jgi:hypothetical protein
MADNGTRTASQYGRHFPGERNERRVPNRVDAPMKRV